MKVFYVLIGTALMVYAVFSFSSIMVNHPKWKYYKITYEAIKTDKYIYTNTTTSYDRFVQPNNKDNWWTDDDILFFFSDYTGERESIKLLGKNRYIHSGTLNWFDPYSAYWFHKLHNLAREKKRAPYVTPAPEMTMKEAELSHEPVKDKTKS